MTDDDIMKCFVNDGGKCYCCEKELYYNDKDSYEFRDDDTHYPTKLICIECHNKCEKESLIGIAATIRSILRGEGQQDMEWINTMIAGDTLQDKIGYKYLDSFGHMHPTSVAKVKKHMKTIADKLAEDYKW